MGHPILDAIVHGLTPGSVVNEYNTLADNVEPLTADSSLEGQLSRGRRAKLRRQGYLAEVVTFYLGLACFGMTATSAYTKHFDKALDWGAATAAIVLLREQASMPAQYVNKFFEPANDI